MAITMKAARVNCGLTQKEAAQKLGVGRSTLIKWETGALSPRVDQLPMICELYGRTVDEIIFLPKAYTLSEQ